MDPDTNRRVRSYSLTKQGKQQIRPRCRDGSDVVIAFLRRAAAAAELDPALPLAELRTMDEHLQRSLSKTRRLSC